MTARTKQPTSPTEARERRFQQLMRREAGKRWMPAAEVWGRAMIQMDLKDMDATPGDLYEYDGCDLEENGIMAHVDVLQRKLTAGHCGRNEIEYVLERCAAYIERCVRAREPVSLAMAKVYEILATGVQSWTRKAGAA